MDSINSRFVFFDIIFVILAGLPLLIHKKSMYQLFERIVSLICLYVIMAVFLSNIKNIQQGQFQPVWTYGMGYVLGFITFGFALMMTGMIKMNRKKLAV